MIVPRLEYMSMVLLVGNLGWGFGVGAGFASQNPLSETILTARCGLFVVGFLDPLAFFSALCKNIRTKAPKGSILF